MVERPVGPIRSCTAFPNIGERRFCPFSSLFCKAWIVLSSEVILSATNVMVDSKDGLPFALLFVYSLIKEAEWLWFVNLVTAHGC